MYYSTPIDTQTRSKQMTKTTNLYQVREFIGTAYSKQLGRRLRVRTDAQRLVRMLKKQGRDVFATPVRISA